MCLFGLDTHTTHTHAHNLYRISTKFCLPLAQVSRGKLHLVDLAGSERLGRSKATGIHLKETQAINKVRVCTTIGLELLTFSILSP